MADMDSEQDVAIASQTLTVEPGGAGLRLDMYLVETLPGVSRSKVQSAIKSGHVSLNDSECRSSDEVREGDRILWNPPVVQAMDCAVAEDLPMEILFEDKWLIVVNKAAGMVVHPGAGHSSGTLVSALLHHGSGLSSAGGDLRPGIVHRLDKETSGCLVVAKNDEVHAALASQFESRSISKVYLAAVSGRLRKPSGKVDVPIDRHPQHRQKMAVCAEGKGRESLTEYRMLAMHDGVSLVECHPHTGRTHQIRVHLKHLGCPVLGDPVYGKRGDYSRHLLHAWKLSFRHPKTGAPVSIVAPVPADFIEPLPPPIQLALENLE